MGEEIIACEAQMMDSGKKMMSSNDYRVRVVFDITGKEVDQTRVCRWLADVRSGTVVILTMALKGK